MGVLGPGTLPLSGNRRPLPQPSTSTPSTIVLPFHPQGNAPAASSAVGSVVSTVVDTKASHLSLGATWWEYEQQKT